MLPFAERPVVTYALFAFNQERFIRQAVEAAFAQTYKPLEIVLSDDCSSDQTFAIMRDMAANYHGPHQVRLVRNATNLGVLAHVIARGREAQGDIVVLAAGDDVSRPERTERLFEAFKQGTGCVFSRVAIIDDHGKMIAPIAERPMFLPKPSIFVRQPQNRHPVIQGCSAAYRKWVFDIPVDPAGKAYAEDLLFSFYINCLDAQIKRLPTPLVLYRAHAAALSNARNRPIDPVSKERREVQMARAQCDMLADFEMLSERIGCSDRLDRPEVARERRDMGDVVEWSSLTVTQRFVRTFGPSRILGRKMPWRLLRLFGQHPFYQPRTALARFIPMLR